MGDPKQPTKQIDVFLMFEETDRNNVTLKGKKKIEKGPNWQALKVEVARKGYSLNVLGPPSHPAVSEVLNSLSSAEVTVFVGHGSSTTAGSQFVSSQLKLSDGMINSGDGLYQGKWNGGTLTPDVGTTPGKVKINKVTGLFTCNSNAEMPKAFDIPEGSNLITNDGGTDGLTRIGTLEQAAYDFVRQYVVNGGDTVKAMNKAQFTFVKKGKEYSTDKGDQLHAVTAAP